MWAIIGIVSLSAAIVAVIGTATLVAMRSAAWKKWLIFAVIALAFYIIVSIAAPYSPDNDFRQIARAAEHSKHIWDLLPVN
jgi:apolipoprotein N-acyltransferase